MNKVSVLFIFFVNLWFDSQSQTISDELIIGFFNKTFSNYFEQRDSIYKDFYILKDSVPEKIQVTYQDFKLHLIDYSQAYPLIKKHKISSLFWARMRIISPDTIDIIVGGWTVNFERVLRIQKVDGKRKLVLRNYNFVAWDGGTIGYIPESRFIFNPDSKVWIYLTTKQLIKKRLYDLKIL
jgi:hypothetical protein